MYTPRQLSDKLGVSKETLRRWEINGLISATKTAKGHRRYHYSDDTFSSSKPTPSKHRIIYARVSSSKQQDDLSRQISSLTKMYPQHTVLSDIGSGLNYQRKGLQRLLELTFQGAVSEVVVAHRDRLSRFGYELFDFIFQQHGTVLKVVDSSEVSPTSELAQDIISIITVFSARYYGSRKYHSDKETQDSPKQ